MRPVPVRPNVETLHAHLCERLAELRPLVVSEVMRTFLEVSTLDCELQLWSLAFAFDEDDGRVAHIEAQFADWNARAPSEDGLRGYEIQVLLPRVLRTGAAPVVDATTEPALSLTGEDRKTLSSRFVRALADLGSYRSIEGIEAVAADAVLL